MAYMDFRGAQPALADGPSRRHAPIADRIDRVGFARLEWTVIALARHERIVDAPPGRIARLAARLFGAKSALPLADPRLEALRRVAVSLWRGREPTTDAATAFERQGFTRAQLDLLRATIATFQSAAA